MEKNRRNYTPIPETGLIRTEAAGSEAGEMTENASREQRRRRRFEKERTSREQEQRRERGRGGRLVRARRQWREGQWFGGVGYQRDSAANEI